MATRIKGVFLLTFLLGFCLAVWLFLIESGEEELIPSDRPIPETVLPESVPSQRMNGSPVKEKLEADKIFLAGSVIDRTTGFPLKTFSMRLKRKEGEWRSKEIGRDAQSDSIGRFAFPLDEGGQYLLHVKAPGYISTMIEDISVPIDRSLRDFVIEMEPVRRINGRVVDYKGNSVEGVFVVASPLGEDESEGFDGSAETDEEGRFTLEGLRDDLYRIIACHVDFDETSVDVLPSGNEILIRLKEIPYHYIRGTALDDEGKPAFGVEIIIWCKDLPDGQVNTFRVQTNEAGEYISPPLSPGRAEVTARVPPWERRFQFTEETRQARIIDSDVEVDFGPSARFATWKGTMYGWDGEPLPHGGIKISMIKPLVGNEPLLSARTVLCDHLGRFSANKLVPGQYKVTLNLWRTRLGGYRNIHFYEWDKLVLDTLGIFRKDIRLPGGEIRGRVLAPGTVETLDGKYRFRCRITATHSSGRSFTVYTDREGRFHLKGLPPGVYSLLAGEWDLGSKKVDNVLLHDNQVLEDVNIQLSVQGTLDLWIYGSDMLNRNFRIHFKREDNLDTYPSLFQSDSIEDCCGYIYHIDKGSWTVTLENEAWGRAERRFEVSESSTTEINLRASDFSHR